MKRWIDDVRPAPAGWTWVKSVDDAKRVISNRFTCSWYETMCGDQIEIISLDYDAGEFAQFGGDYIKLLDWLEEEHLCYPIHLHTANPVGRENMRRIIRRNGWKEV